MLKRLKRLLTVSMVVAMVFTGVAATTFASGSQINIDPNNVTEAEVYVMFNRLLGSFTSVSSYDPQEFNNVPEEYRQDVSEFFDRTGMVWNSYANAHARDIVNDNSVATLVREVPTLSQFQEINTVAKLVNAYNESFVSGDNQPVSKQLVLWTSPVEYHIIDSVSVDYMLYVDVRQFFGALGVEITVETVDPPEAPWTDGDGVKITASNYAYPIYVRYLKDYDDYMVYVYDVAYIFGGITQWPNGDIAIGSVAPAYPIPSVLNGDQAELVTEYRLRVQKDVGQYIDVTALGSEDNLLFSRILVDTADLVDIFSVLDLEVATQEVAISGTDCIRLSVNETSSLLLYAVDGKVDLRCVFDEFKIEYTVDVPIPLGSSDHDIRFATTFIPEISPNKVIDIYDLEVEFEMGGSATVMASMNKLVPRVSDSTALVLVAYDASGAMVSHQRLRVAPMLNSLSAVRYQTGFYPGLFDTVATVKVFVWDSMETMQPISNVFVDDIN